MNHVTEAAVRMQGITKSFSGVVVLDKVNFELRTGEIHALLGENGAGKSTLMKILRGVYTLDSGTMDIMGKPVQLVSPQDAKDHGIAMVFQEFSLIPTLTVAQNIFLNREPRNALGLIDDTAAERGAEAIFRQMGVDIDPRETVSNLSTGYRQLTEIAAALSQQGRVLILDEPTASLTRSETLALFDIMRRLKARGISMIYISHRMEEIFQIADRITVLRDGRVMITAEAANLTVEKVIEHIIGHKSRSVMEWQPHEVNLAGTPLLEVENLSSLPQIKALSFRLYPGEVLGIAGLMGSGRTELVQTLFGLRDVNAGRVFIRGKEVRIRRTEQAVAHGIALVPEDRRTQGLVLGHTVRDNLLLPLIKLRRLSMPGGLVDDPRGSALTRDYIRDLHIRTPSIDTPTRQLSGGNQQKIVLAKWLSIDPDILLLDEATAGVDVGTKGEIVEMVRQLAMQGKGLIFISSELPELLAVSDRILIMRQGRVEREIDRRQIQSEESLHHILQGAKDQ